MFRPVCSITRWQYVDARCYSWEKNLYSSAVKLFFKGIKLLWKLFVLFRWKIFLKIADNCIYSNISIHYHSENLINKYPWTEVSHAFSIITFSTIAFVSSLKEEGGTEHTVTESHSAFGINTRRCTKRSIESWSDSEGNRGHAEMSVVQHESRKLLNMV